MSGRSECPIHATPCLPAPPPPLFMLACMHVYFVLAVLAVTACLVFGRYSPVSACSLALKKKEQSVRFPCTLVVRRDGVVR